MVELDNSFSVRPSLTSTTRVGESNNQEPSLQQYWSALEMIDVRYREVVKAYEDLLWHQEKMQEADELLKGEDFEQTSFIQLDRSLLPSDFSRNMMESALEQCGEQKKQLLDLRFQSSKKLQDLKRDLNDLRNALNNLLIEADQLTDRINFLKTARMGYIVFLICVGIVSAIGTGNTIATLIITGIILAVVSYVDLADK